MCSRSASVTLMAFSQAITARRGPSARLRSPSAITGATNFSTVGPTAVVTMSAEASSSTTAGSSPRLLIAR